MAVATRSVFSTLVLLVLFLYVFAIIFKQQSEDNEVLEGYFSTIPAAMWNLLLAGTLLDGITDVLNDIQGENWVLCAVFLMFVLISSFTVLNMLIGVLCEVVSAVALAEKEEMVVKFVKHQLIGVLMAIDVEGEGKISQDQFKEFVNHDESDPAFQELGVDKENLLSLVDIIFAVEDDVRMSSKGTNQETEDEEANPQRTASKMIGSRKTGRPDPPLVKLSFAEIIEMILNLRSSNGAMVKDIVELRKFIRKNQDGVMASLERMEIHHESMFEVVSSKQDELLSAVKSLAKGIQSLEDKLECSPSPKPPRQPKEPVDKDPLDFFSVPLPKTPAPGYKHVPPPPESPHRIMP
jgi:hypothetical protein